MKPFRYLHIAPWRVWRWMMTGGYHDRRIGIFRNLPHIKPGRWGFFVFGLEIGSRNPQDPVGVWLKRRGLWPW
jgi:hypothetical protein